ncbi:MAG: HNH endonuclease [Wenzhouxiangellaceae bacterium]|nr:HNH endonuclease [Wenzhouxiangellaceae bacterium]
MNDEDSEALAISERLREKIEQLLKDYHQELRSGTLRTKVQALVPVFRQLRELGKSLMPIENAKGARDRILVYFREHPGAVIEGDELLVISGIQEYARRIRELRVQFGWAITSGTAVREMISQEDDSNLPAEYRKMKPDDYVLLRIEQDKKAAHRWHLANSIRKSKGSVRQRILDFLLANLGEPVLNEELRYVANNKTEWARRVRELRTEYGWQVASKTTGRPDLAIGEYVLESDRQLPSHDRRIPDDVRGFVLRRDEYKCQECGWGHSEWNSSDPRHLELHHIEHHAQGGKNVASNLRTLCNRCHDKEHRNIQSRIL